MSGWIQDKLPERATPVLVTVQLKRGKRQVAVGTYWTPGKGHDGEAGWDVAGFDEFAPPPVMAWQPLPKAFDK